MSASEAEGHWFESSRARHYQPVYTLREISRVNFRQGGGALPKCSALKAPETREGCEVAERVMCVLPPNTETGNN